MKQQTILLAIVLTFVLMLTSTEATGGQPSVSDQTVWLGDWDFVATLDGGRVDSFLALRDPSLAVGSNVTAVWFRLKDDRQWEALAWHDPGNLKAIAHVKVTLGLPDATDAIWPDASVEQAGGFVDPSLAVEPDAFATGVFADDSFAPVIEATSDPAPLVGALTSTGYPSASLPVQTQGCSQDDILSTMAAMVEADLGANGGAGAGGTIIADFSVSQAPCDLWQSVTAALDDQGMWLVPDLAPYLEATATIDPADAWQSIAVGTAFVGPQTMVIDAGGIDAAGDQVVAVKLVVSIKDMTPPSLELELLGDDMPPMVSPGGLDYFVAPVTISVNHLALDNVDGVVIASTLNVEVYVDCTKVDGGPGDPGGPGEIIIASTGYYTLRARVRDSAGNATYVSQVFEVRDRYNLEAAAVVENLTITPGTGFDTVDATILLTSETFDPTTINLTTFALWLTDAQDEEAGPSPLGLASGYLINGAYDPALVSMSQGVWRLAVSGQVPQGALSQSGVVFFITGSGLHNTPESYDFMTREASFDSITNAQSSILSLVTPQSMSDNPPPPPASQPCQWKSQFIMDNDPPVDQYFTMTTETCIWECAGTNYILSASPWNFVGYGHVWESCPTFCNLGQSEARAVSSSGIMLVTLEGENCCSECEIDVLARPKFKARVEIIPRASAAAGGVLSVTIPGCGRVEAAGGVAVSSVQEGDFSIDTPWGGVTVPYLTQARESENDFTGDSDCDEPHRGCDIRTLVTTIARMEIIAETTVLWGGASAVSRLWNAVMRLTVTPSVTGTDCGDVIGDGIPIKYDICSPWELSP